MVKGGFLSEKMQNFTILFSWWDIFLQATGEWMGFSCCLPTPDLAALKHLSD